MFEDYKKELLAFYLHKKETHQLSGNLENLQRSNLRKQCLNVFSKKHTKNDLEIIKAFFDPAGKLDDPVRSIEKVSLDKFRPLISFLQEEKNIRDDASVKLLAWLIGFYSYQEWRVKQETKQPGDPEGKGLPGNNEYGGDTEGKGLPGNNESGGDLEGKVLPGNNESGGDKPDDTGGKDLPGNNESGGDKPDDTGGKDLPGNNESGEDKPDDTSSKDLPGGDTYGEDLPGDDERKFLQKILSIIIGRPFSIKNAAISCITILFLAGGVFFLVEKNTSDTIRQPLADEKCMYWTGNHYEPVKCDEKIKNATIIPINLRVLNNLKRINVTDTLTSYSLGKVWYLNIRRKPEFFTDSGMHPVETSKKLKPLSKHILSNHVSYYRYLLIHLIWLICVIITVVLFMVCLMYFLRRKKKI